MSYVYIIECGNMYKIGKAENVIERFKQLQTGNPFPMRIVKVYQTPLAYNLETYIHKQLQDYRQTGEWFNLLGIEQVDSIVERFNNELETKMMLKDLKQINEKSKRISEMQKDLIEILEMNISIPEKKHLIAQKGLIMFALDSRKLLQDYGIDLDRFKRIKVDRYIS